MQLQTQKVQQPCMCVCALCGFIYFILFFVFSISIGLELNASSFLRLPGFNTPHVEEVPTSVTEGYCRLLPVILLSRGHILCCHKPKETFPQWLTQKTIVSSDGDRWSSTQKLKSAVRALKGHVFFPSLGHSVCRAGRWSHQTSRQPLISSVSVPFIASCNCLIRHQAGFYLAQHKRRVKY